MVTNPGPLNTRRIELNSSRLALAALLLASTLTACTASRELGLGHPSVQSEPLPVLAGASVIDGDDYYVQLLSEFQFRGDVGEDEVCRDIGGSYRKGGANSLLLFQVSNPTLKFRREVPGLLYRTTSGRCASSLDAKRVYLTPWMRLDTAADTQVDYRFVTSNDDDLDLVKLGNDVNVASNVLAVTGVGTGVALVGKLASGWMTNTGQIPAIPNPAVTEAAPKRHEESHSLSPTIVVSGNRATLNRMSIAVREAEIGSFSPLAKPRPLGELKVYADLRASLLLKNAPNGLPDARDLSLEELLRATLRNGVEGLSLQRTIEQADHPDRPNLQPDWNNYQEVESNCRKLKVVMRDLGFNKYDRNAVLYYFLDKTPAWKHYNRAGQKVISTGMPVSRLEEHRAGGFGGCLSEDDYEVMKSLSLPVNAAQDWANTLQQLREKESYFSTIRALERQLVAVVRNPNPAEMERQLFPLIGSRQSGAGTVLLQDRLGNFGIERLLNIAPVPGEGAVLSAAQLAQLFTGLKVADTSCARPAYEQGRPVPNVAILLFSTVADSSLAKGAAMEFEFEGNRIVRIALQSPTFRDFRQDVIANPQVGDCRIQPQWVEWLGVVN